MIQSPLAFNHSILKNHIQDGATVIDATVGNGNDFIFLMKQVGSSGKVIGFDIQQSAVDKTREKVQSISTSTQTQILLDSHENLLNYVEKNFISAIVFNLGYLPKGDKSIITKPTSTISAIEAGLKALEPRGLMTIMIYHGHEGGAEERHEVETYLSKLDQQHFTIMRYQPVNQKNSPPYLLIIQKL